VQRAPVRRLVTGMPPGGGLSGIPPMWFTRCRPARVQVKPPQRVTAGMLPGKGLSGIPPASFTRPRQAPPVPLRARSRIIGGLPGSLTRPLPVPAVLRNRQRIRPVTSRLIGGVPPPVAAQPAVAQQAVLRAAGRRPVRAPGQRLLRGVTIPAAVTPVTAGMLRGRAGTRPSAGRQRLTGPAFVPPPPRSVSVPRIVLRWRSPAARRGRLTWPLQAPAPPPAFTVGTLTAATAPLGILGTADTPASALSASTAAPGVITAGDQRTGGPG